MALNEIRGSVTLDSLARKIGDLIEISVSSASLSNGLADDLCGQSPNADATGERDVPANGKLESLDQLLDVVASQLNRSRVALRRIERVVRAGPETEQTATSAKSAF